MNKIANLLKLRLERTNQRKLNWKDKERTRKLKVSVQRSNLPKRKKRSYVKVKMNLSTSKWYMKKNYDKRNVSSTKKPRLINNATKIWLSSKNNKVVSLTIIQRAVHDLMKAIKEMNQERELEKKLKDDEQRRLQDKIDNMIKKSKKKRKEIEDDAWDKIDRIKDQNKEELALTIDAGMASKGLLTTETGQHREAKNEKEKLETENKT
eukprot:CAMPEP_0116889266 /NCGR_PEP_ID=MMETSP0463-20121206/24667_1 /TAXON_ID=181622 /ORGANISM="Strombidinopsis sp, Strain SopsisLIS2011" /LENGTH=207 /DNA_ID=CAMNT_0004555617 /DNA_START=2231 /DNA_END=2856 /DNA_ORIENTATION=+